MLLKILYSVKSGYIEIKSMKVENHQQEEFNSLVPIQIRFSDIDALGHINNNVYFSYFDLGKITYFENLRTSYVSWTDGIVVVARIEVDFIVPVFYKEKIVVESKIKKIGTKSAVFLQQISNPLTKEIKCVAQSTIVAFNPTTKAAMAIPEIWREGISDFEGVQF